MFMQERKEKKKYLKKEMKKEKMERKRSLFLKIDMKENGRKIISMVLERCFLEK